MKQRGFTIVDTPGSVTVEFHKEYLDETIRIEFETQEINDEDDTFKIFDVIITKKQPASHYLVISCTVYPLYKQLSVRHVPIGDTPTSPEVFDGPHLYNLSRPIQAGIIRFLAARGVDEKFVEFLRYYNSTKMLRETVYALDGFSSFLKST